MKQRLSGTIGDPSEQPLLRRSEIALIGYFLYAGVVGLFLAIPRETSRFTLLLNLAIVGGYFILRTPRSEAAPARDQHGP